MQYTATITSKRQLTIPVRLYLKHGLKQGQKVLLKSEAGAIKFEPAEALVRRLAGSVSLPKKYQGLNVDEVIKAAKRQRFNQR